MNLPVETWHRAIAKRVSYRSFVPELPEEDLLARMDHTCRDFRPFPEARAVLVRGPIERVARGIVGRYGRISGALCYLAFIGRMDSSRVQECVGYTGEGLILEATALGLGTCWVGGFFRPCAVGTAAGLCEGERVIAISPVGKPSRKPSLTDRSFKALAGSARRIRLKDLLEGGCVPEGKLRPALEAARLSPSARNRQPWRFRLGDRTITIFTTSLRQGGRISRRLDCGIAMLHFELGARAAGLEGDWEFLEAPEVARFRIPMNSFA